MRWDMNSSLTFAKSLANQDNIRIQMANPNHAFRPYSQNGTIHLSPPSPENLDTYEPDLHRCISQNFEEVKYVQDLSYEEGSRSQITQRLLGDYLGEKAKLGEYQGRDEILSNHRAKSMSGFDIESIEDQKLKGLLHTLTRARNDWQSYVHDDIESSLEKFKDSDGETFVDKLNKCSSKEDLRELIQLVETVEQEEEDTKQEEGDGDGNGERSDNGKNDQGSDDGSEEDDGDAEGNDSEGDNSKDSGGGKESSDGEGEGNREDSQSNDEGDERDGEGDSGNGKDTDECDGNDQPSQEHGVGFNDQEALESANILGQSTRAEIEPEVGDYTPQDISNKREVEPNCSYDEYSMKELNKLLDALKLSKKVKRHLLSLSQVGYEYGLKRGKLNNKAISRVYTSKSPQPRIYKQKNSSRLEVETAVSIVCDCSGSMSGDKYMYASASCIATSLILQDLKIAHEIVGFSTSGNQNLYFNFKRYNEFLVSRELLAKRFLSYNIRMGCNSDGEALTYCMEHLLNRKEKSKVLLILSDGAPAGSGRGCSYSYLQRIAKGIEEEGRVNLAAIGIRTSCVKKFYSNYQIVNDEKDLEPAILQVMSKNIIR